MSNTDRHCYAYYGHNRPQDDGIYRAPKKMPEAMGHTAEVHLVNYARFQPDGTTEMYKVAFEGIAA